MYRISLIRPHRYYLFRKPWCCTKKTRAHTDQGRGLYSKRELKRINSPTCSYCMCGTRDDKENELKLAYYCNQVIYVVIVYNCFVLILIQISKRIILWNWAVTSAITLGVLAAIPLSFVQWISLSLNRPPRITKPCTVYLRERALLQSGQELPRKLRARSDWENTRVYIRYCMASQTLQNTWCNTLYTYQLRMY